MKFLKLINRKIVNWEEIAYFDVEDGKYPIPYLYLKNGKSFELFDRIDCFSFLNDDKKYIFCIDCYIEYVKIIIKELNEYFEDNGDCIADIEQNHEYFFDKFMKWAKGHKDLLEFVGKE